MSMSKEAMVSLFVGARVSDDDTSWRAECVRALVAFLRTRMAGKGWLALHGKLRVWLFEGVRGTVVGVF